MRLLAFALLGLFAATALAGDAAKYGAEEAPPPPPTEPPYDEPPPPAPTTAGYADEPVAMTTEAAMTTAAAEETTVADEVNPVAPDSYAPTTMAVVESTAAPEVTEAATTAAAVLEDVPAPYKKVRRIVKKLILRRRRLNKNALNKGRRNVKIIRRIVRRRKIVN